MKAFATSGSLPVAQNVASIWSKITGDIIIDGVFREANIEGCMQIGGSRNSLALDVDGQILAWGWNARATLGLGHGYALCFA